MAQNKTVQELYHYENNIGDEGAMALAQNKTLQELNLYENNIGTEAKALVRLSFEARGATVSFKAFHINKVLDMKLYNLACEGVIGNFPK